ncbi:hypothetical protein PY650_14235 [Rhizobium calliandrae]|uniref:DUF3307 domain-containing protein n=1 Tax=Rhizobium calliandrae TaxID=1312182 RepID=A0ABT7KDW5_9HYPH|nr:hypothetical protein [Rhizobium calliandrae]MDL2406797.1 hypothetical protein [Rhizobium calliandrae]
MAIDGLLLTTLVWLQMKHFAADYVLRPAWMISGKRNFRKPGAYLRAGIHAVATVPIPRLSMPDLMWIVTVAIGEYVVHFQVGHLKAVLWMTTARLFAVRRRTSFRGWSILKPSRLRASL